MTTGSSSPSCNWQAGARDGNVATGICCSTPCTSDEKQSEQPTHQTPEELHQTPPEVGSFQESMERFDTNRRAGCSGSSYSGASCRGQPAPSWRIKLEPSCSNHSTSTSTTSHNNHSSRTTSYAPAAVVASSPTRLPTCKEAFPNNFGGNIKQEPRVGDSSNKMPFNKEATRAPPVVIELFDDDAIYDADLSMCTA